MPLHLFTVQVELTAAMPAGRDAGGPALRARQIDHRTKVWSLDGGERVSRTAGLEGGRGSRVFRILVLGTDAVEQSDSATGATSKAKRGTEKALMSSCSAGHTAGAYRVSFPALERAATTAGMVTGFRQRFALTGRPAKPSNAAAHPCQAPPSNVLPQAADAPPQLGLRCYDSAPVQVIQLPKIKNK